MNKDLRWEVSTFLAHSLVSNHTLIRVLLRTSTELFVIRARFDCGGEKEESVFSHKDRSTRCRVTFMQFNFRRLRQAGTPSVLGKSAA